jgi:hypothetical protein
MRRLLTFTTLGALYCAIWAASCSTQPTVESVQRCDEHPLYSRLVESGDGRLRVIVTLDTAQADEAAQLQDRLLLQLEGTDYNVVRRSTNFPIITLSVREDAFCRLITSPLVATIQQDVPEPPGN